MSIADRLISLIAPYECLGCDTQGKLLCGNCVQLFDQVPERCYRCRSHSPGAETCKKCRKVSRLRRVQVGTVYEGIAKQIVWKLKFGGVQSAASLMVTSLPSLASDCDGAIFVPIATATGRARQRGYNQAELLTKEIAKREGKPWLDALSRSTQFHQIGASRKQRLEQLTNDFRVKRPRRLKNAHVILVDDVLTTGATLQAAANALVVAGAKRVDAIVFAQA